jgi:hypothetical protein
MRLLRSAILWLVTANTLFAAIPQQINYQGFLTNASGAPLDTTVAMTFKLYWDIAGPDSVVWQESHAAVIVSEGLFHVVLGTTTLIPPSALDFAFVSLGVTVGSNSEMLPRADVKSTAYALLAEESGRAIVADSVETVDGAGGGIIMSDLIVHNRLNVGSGNTNSGSFANVLGENNISSGDHAIVGGGGNNRARGLFATIGGGGGFFDADSNAAGGAYSTVAGGRQNRADSTYTFVGGGFGNRAAGLGATVSGGQYNFARGTFATVAGGGSVALVDSNSAIGNTSAIGGGRHNIAAADNTTVSGGQFNTASGVVAAVGGGQSNVASGIAATVGGGSLSKARGSLSVVAGGGGFVPADSNSAAGDYSTVSGGRRNWTDNSYSTVCGGFGNRATGSGTTVGGGQNNFARGMFATIAGGGFTTLADSNSALGDFSFIGGGDANLASAYAATVGGGEGNHATGGSSVIAGGAENDASGNRSTIAGGRYNHARGDHSVIAGGGGDTPVDSNSARGIASTILGGRRNETTGRFSCAAGYRAKANHDGAFVWADSTGADFTSTAADQFNVRASGGTRIFTNAATTLGAQLAPNATAWSTLSDSTKKIRYGRLDTKEILEKLSRIPLERWSYKDDPNHVNHAGPMAQDFYAAFGLGESDTTISTLDPDGIALAAIQELTKRNEKLEAEVAELKAIVREQSQFGLRGDQ